MKAQVSFSVSADIAERARLTEVRYKTKDGRYILTNKDLARLELTPEEYMGGIDVILLTEEEAGLLIAEGGFVFGDNTEAKAVLEEEPAVVEAADVDGTGDSEAEAEAEPEEEPEPEVPVDDMKDSDSSEEEETE